MKYPALRNGSGSPPSFQRWANDPTPPRRNSFPANKNSAPSPQKAANHKKAAINFGRRIAAKRLARQALNIHPVGRAINTALDLIQLAGEYGHLLPGQKGRPDWEPSGGWELRGSCPTGGPTHFLYVRRSSGTTTVDGQANRCLGGQGFADPHPVGGAISSTATGMTGLQHTHNASTGRPRFTIVRTWYRPNPGPSEWLAPQPDKAPAFLPWQAPQYRPSQDRRPAAPQRKPGISYNRNVRPNNLGVLELRVTGSRTSLRINSENRPNRPGQTEKKGVSRSWAAFKALHRIADASTEAVDFLEVLATSTGYDGPTGGGNARAMIEHVYNNLENFDPELFLIEFLKNELEDQAIGRASGLVDKSSKKLGIRNPEVGLAL